MLKLYKAGAIFDAGCLTTGSALASTFTIDAFSSVSVDVSLGFATLQELAFTDPDTGEEFFDEG